MGAKKYNPEGVQSMQCSAKELVNAVQCKRAMQCKCNAVRRQCRPMHSKAQECYAWSGR